MSETEQPTEDKITGLTPEQTSALLRAHQEAANGLMYAAQFTATIPLDSRTERTRALIGLGAAAREYVRTDDLLRDTFVQPGLEAAALAQAVKIDAESAEAAAIELEKKNAAPVPAVVPDPPEAA